MPLISERGLTLVEIMVVITIITVMATVGMALYQGVLQKARYAQTEDRMRRLYTKMEEYKSDYGKLPPTANVCTDCGGSIDANAWNTVLDDLEAKGYLKSSEKAEYQKDAWGNPFGYSNCGGNFSRFYTIGPNKTKDRNNTNFVRGGECGVDDWCLDFTFQGPAC